MKKSILFLAALVGLLCFASCQKSEGDDPNDLFIGNDSSLFAWKVTPNVDFADLQVKANFNDTTTTVEVFSMALVLFEAADTTQADSTAASSQEVLKLELIKEFTEVDRTWRMDTIMGGLKPRTAYKGYLRMEDFFGAHQSDTVEFVTKGTIGGTVLVTTDSVKTDSTNNLLFYGSVRTHFRALESTGVELKIKYGDTDSTLNNVLSNWVIDEMTEPVDDTVVCKYHCTTAMMDSCWFQAAVKDSWGNEYVADSIMQYSNESPRAVWAKTPTVEGATMVTLKGNCDYHGAQHYILKEHGFCYMEGEGVPTISDSVCYDVTTQEWNRSFTQTLTNLKPNTTYSCRVFFKLAAFTTYYSDEVKTFTTEDVVNVALLDPLDIQQTSMELKAVIGQTERLVDSCRFIWREINNDQDPGILTLENMTGNAYCILEEGTHSFATTIEGLTPNQMYVLGAYIRMKNGEVWFSNTLQAKTKE